MVNVSRTICRFTVGRLHIRFRLIGFRCIITVVIHRFCREHNGARTTIGLVTLLFYLAMTAYPKTRPYDQ